MTLEYLEVGDSSDPVVILLHGFPDSPRSFDAVAGAIADAGFFAVVPWMRGYAPSPLSGPYHAEQLAADVIDLADAVSPAAPCAIAGHDWGAIATYAAIALAPHRFDKAIAMSIPHPLAFAFNARRSLAQIRRSLYMPLLGTPLIGPFAAQTADMALIRRLWRTWSPGFELADAAREQLEDCLRESLPAPVLYYRALPQTLRFFSGATRRLDVPVLYLHGERDGCCSPTMARGQERFFVSIESKQYAHVGHFMQVEDPQTVSADIVAFLTRSHM